MRIAAALLATVLLASTVAAQPCQPHWSQEFGNGEVDGLVRCLLIRDTPAGQDLYAGGGFTQAGNIAASRIARWDGQQWYPLGEGVDGSLGGPTRVYAAAVFDDGGGPALYVGGEFTQAGGQAASCVAKWDGQTWSPVGGGLNGVVRALKVYDDGDGQALYAAGGFSQAGPIAASGIAKWTGTSWSAIGGGLPAGSIGYALEVFDDGSGLALILGGAFASVSGVSAANIARFGSAGWSGIGGGTSDFVLALAAIDLGGGTRLYAGGQFGSAGGVWSPRIAQWDGGSWSAMAPGVAAQFVTSIVAYGEGPERSIYVGFPSASGYGDGIWRWSGSAWTLAGQGLHGTVRCLAEYTTPQGRVLVAGGEPTSPVAPRTEIGIARRSGTSAWETGLLPKGADGGSVRRLLSGGPDGELVVAGDFRELAGVSSPALIRWSPTAGWAAQGFAAGDTVSDATYHGEGPAAVLYAAGVFPALGSGHLASRVARRENGHWIFLGPYGAAPVAAFPFGPGSALYGVSPTSVLLRYASNGWVNGPFMTATSITRMSAFDVGGGSRLYIAGRISAAGGTPVNNIAAWDGTNWWDLGGGLVPIDTQTPVYAMAVFDDGGGPAVYITGSFNSSSGPAINNIARWNGSAWSPLGDGIMGRGLAMSVFNDGSGPALYVGGSISSAGTAPAKNLARWDGLAWSPVAGGANGLVEALATTSDATGSSLWVGGTFTYVGGINASRIARLIACVPPCYANCDGSTTPPVLNVADFICFLNKYAAADPYANCDNSTTPPILNVSDFICFQTRFAQGCP